MNRLRDVLVMLVVACAVPGSTFVLGQASEAAAPTQGVVEGESRRQEGWHQEQASCPRRQARRGCEAGGRGRPWS